jgi:hypothetical protein
MSGYGDEYTYDEVDEFYDFWDEQFGGETVEGMLVITAQVEWAGTVMKKNDGVRTVRLDGLTSAQLIAIQNEFGAAAAAGNWATRYNIVKDSESAKRAGLRVSRTTARRWARGTQQPSKANRAKINEAYKRETRERAVNKVTEELRNSYDVNVRFRNITDMHLQ